MEKKEVTLKRSKWGHLFFHPVPSKDELEKFYAEKYYGFSDGRNCYSYQYTAEEIQHKSIAPIESLSYFNRTPKTHLDIACGEGHFMNYLSKQGILTTGLDYTSVPAKTFFPHQAKNIIECDVENEIKKIGKNAYSYDFISMNQILHHLRKPDLFLRDVKKIMKKNSILRISVPNNNSLLQYYLEKNHLLKKSDWVLYPDHQSYFNADSLKKMLLGLDFKIVDFLGDFPIEIYLLNPNSNYKLNKSLGRDAHFTRIKYELDLFLQDRKKFHSYRKAMGVSEMCREFTIYCKVK